MIKTIFPWIALSTLFLVGCASQQPIVSTPPQRRFVCIDNSGNRLIHVNQRQPEQNWTVSVPKGSRDLQLIPGGRVLVSQGNGAGEYDLKTGKSCWSVSGFKGVQTAQRLPDGTTLIGQDGGAFAIIDTKGNTLKLINAPKTSHLRLARILDNGNILYASGYEVHECTPKGKLVKSQRLPDKSYVGKKLQDGTLIATAGGKALVVEIDSKGETIRTLGGKEAHPEMNLAWFSGMQVLDNGNVMVANWQGHGFKGTSPHLIEFTPENTIAWKWSDNTVKSITNVLVLNQNDERISVRAQPFLVNPSTGPATGVMVRNSGTTPFTGTLGIQFPEGWKLTPETQPITLKPGETKLFPYAIEKAVELKSNRYPVTLEVKEKETPLLVRNQTVVALSAPYFTPKIDGNLKDWGDAIPVTFGAPGEETTVMMYWTRKTFYLAVAVEEATLSENDAVQFAIAPANAVTATNPDSPAVRNEFVLTASGKKAICSRLITVGDPLVAATRKTSLTDKALDTATVVIKRRKGKSYYEVAIPFKSIRGLDPDPGREFSLALLVHDADGNTRDLGAAISVWDNHPYNPYFWCDWAGASWNKKVLTGARLEAGFCSSIH